MTVEHLRPLLDNQRDAERFCDDGPRVGECVSSVRDHSSVACGEIDSIVEAFWRSPRHCHRRHHSLIGCPHNLPPDWSIH